MNSTTPRIEEVLAVGHAIAGRHSLSAEDTAALLEAIEWCERSNAEAPGPHSRHEEFSRVFQTKFHALSEAAGEAFLEFAYGEAEFWKNNSAKGIAEEPFQIPIEHGYLTIGFLPEGNVVMTCTAETLLDGSLTLVFPREFSQGLLKFRQGDPIAFQRENREFGNLLRTVANLLFGLQVTTILRPKDAKKLRERFLAKLRELNKLFTSLAMENLPKILKDLAERKKNVQ